MYTPRCSSEVVKPNWSDLIISDWSRHMLWSTFRPRAAGVTRALLFQPLRFLRFQFTTPPTMVHADSMTVDTSVRLAALRKLMQEKPVDAYIVPSEDQRKSRSPLMRRSSLTGRDTQIRASTSRTATSGGHSSRASQAQQVAFLFNFFGER